MKTFLITGKKLDLVSREDLHSYFSRFGLLNDHIVRARGIANEINKNEGYLEDEVGFMLYFRRLLVEEGDLVEQVHEIQGKKVTCVRVETQEAVSDRRVFLRYLDKRATREDVLISMSQFGEVESVQLMYKKNYKINLGLCNVIFMEAESVQKILNEPSVFVRSKKVKVDRFRNEKIYDDLFFEGGSQIPPKEENKKGRTQMISTKFNSGIQHQHQLNEKEERLGSKNFDKGNPNLRKLNLNSKVRTPKSISDLGELREKDSGMSGIQFLATESMDKRGTDFKREYIKSKKENNSGFQSSFFKKSSSRNIFPKKASIIVHHIKPSVREVSPKHLEKRLGNEHFDEKLSSFKEGPMKLSKEGNSNALQAYSKPEIHFMKPTSKKYHCSYISSSKKRESSDLINVRFNILMKGSNQDILSRFETQNQKLFDQRKLVRLIKKPPVMKQTGETNAQQADQQQ